MSNESIAKCDVCQRWVKRHTLRLMAHDLLQLPARNALLWSEYDTSGLNPYWTCDATDGGKVSWGVNGDARIRVNNETTGMGVASVTYLNCAQTFIGSGTARTQVGVDCSAWTNICFWVAAGLHERDPHATATLAMGTCDTSGSNQQEWYNKTVGRSGIRWFSIPVTSLSGVSSSEVCFYMTFTVQNPDPSSGCWWWFEEAAVNDLTKPEHFVRTKGAAVSYTTDTSIRTVAKTCPACREKVFKKSEARGRPNIQFDPPISRDVWEG